MLLEDSFPRQLSLGRGSAVRLRYDGVVMAGPDDGFSDNLDGKLQSCEKEEREKLVKTKKHCLIARYVIEIVNRQQNLVFINTELSSSMICRTLEKVLNSR